MKVSQTNLFSYEALDLRIFENRRRDPSRRALGISAAAARLSPTETRSRPQAPQVVGDLTAGDPPVPIPNTEVKPRRADGTARESVWERRSLPA